MTPEMKAYLEEQIAAKPVAVFMKGTKDFPVCGFSARVAQVFNHLGVDYNDINVLESMELMEGIVEYAQWPTFPQVFVDGELIGGCDITLEMFQNGELVQKLKEAGVTLSAA